MTACPTLTVDGSSGIAEALRVVDCASAEATSLAFGRLFGAGGGLGTALTILLTLYVGLLAIDLLTGRSRLGLNMLTPRMLGLGLALTFATSWVAYQSVVWTLLTGAPDQIAGIITGQSGSATATFAQRLDTLFAAVASAADAAANAPPAPPSEMGITPPPPQAAGWTPADVLWMAAMLLLLGTVGVLLVARIALAALLAVGPIFIVLALFRGTNGLFIGWLKGAVMFALMPLFTVLIGGSALALLTPVVIQLNSGPIGMQPAVTMFLGASVYLALMVMVTKVSGAMVSGWRIGAAPSADRAGRSAEAIAAAAAGPQPRETAQGQPASALQPAEPSGTSDRVRTIVSGTRQPANDLDAPASSDRRASSVGFAHSRDAMIAPASPTAAARTRVQGIGAKFRAPSRPLSGKPQ